MPHVVSRILIAATIALPLFLCGCGEHRPSDTVESYAARILVGDVDGAKPFVVAESIAVLNSVRGEIEHGAQEAAQRGQPALAVVIGEEINGDDATVGIEVKQGAGSHERWFGLQRIDGLWKIDLARAATRPASLSRDVEAPPNAGDRLSSLTSTLSGLVSGAKDKILSAPLQEVRSNSLAHAMDNTARQLGAAAQQYFLETNTTRVSVMVDRNGRVIGPLSAWVTSVPSGIDMIGSSIDYDGQFTLVLQAKNLRQTYTSEGLRAD